VMEPAGAVAAMEIREEVAEPEREGWFEDETVLAGWLVVEAGGLAAICLFFLSSFCASVAWRLERRLWAGERGLECTGEEEKVRTV